MNKHLELSTQNSMLSLDMVKMDKIGCVEDLFGPDAVHVHCANDNINELLPDSVDAEERDEVDGQTILSFNSAEELENFVCRQDSASPHLTLSKTKDIHQIKGWKAKLGHPVANPASCLEGEDASGDAVSLQHSCEHSDRISAELAQFAASAVQSPSKIWRKAATRRRSSGSDASRLTNRVSIMDASTYADELDIDMVEEDLEEVVFLHEDYREDYGIKK